MSRTLALALVLGAVAGPAAAQVATDREAVRLLSRAESLQARLERRDSLGQRRVRVEEHRHHLSWAQWRDDEER